MATTTPSKFLSPSKQFLETNRAFFKMILGASATEPGVCVDRGGHLWAVSEQADVVH